jgi:hypothetical protein
MLVALPHQPPQPATTTVVATTAAAPPLLPAGLSGWVWYTAARMVHVFTHVGDPESDASRVLMLGYGFLTLVMVGARLAGRVYSHVYKYVHSYMLLLEKDIDTYILMHPKIAAGLCRRQHCRLVLLACYR